MNISTYLPDELVKVVDQLANERQVSRSAIIREALEAHLARFRRNGWPPEIMAWNGDPAFPAFESTRGDDDGLAHDPFEATPTRS